MALKMHAVLKGVALAVSAAGLSLLTGCGAGVLAGPGDVAGFKINGNVHGGPYPIQGATIRLMETVSTGTWSKTTNSYTGTARQILTTTSDNLGFFTFPDTGWSCTGGQSVYIQVTGGHTTSQTNANVAQVGVIGDCTTTLGNKAAIDNVNVFISELSTVAAVYTLGDFMSFSTDNNNNLLINITAPANNNSATPGCTGSGSTGNGALACKQAGLAHAFQNAYNLVDSVRYDGSFPSGNARTAIPGNSQSFIPQAEINTLGNILQSCVDSAGGAVGTYNNYTPGGTGSTHCGDLFYYTTPPGSTTSPTNTLQAALNIARFPNNNVDALFKLQPRAVFFTPDLSSDALSGNSAQLMSYTLSVFYTGTGLSGDGGMPYPVELALDANDDVYVAYSGDNTGTTYGAVNEWTANGAGVFAGKQLARAPNPASLVLDANGYAWLSNDSAPPGNVFQINTPASGGTNGTIAQVLTVTGGYSAGLAADTSGNIWVSRDATTGQSLFRFNAGNGYTADNFNTTPSLGYASKRLFVDNKQNIFGVSTDTNNTGGNNSGAKGSIYVFPYNAYGANAVVGTANFTAKNPYAITMSSTNVVYSPLYQEVDTANATASQQNGNTVVTVNTNANASGSNTAKSGTGATYNVPMGIAIDGGGNLFWSDFETTGLVFWLQPSSTTSISNGTLTSFLPCYPSNGQCYSGASTNLRGMTVDSSGAIWYLADSSTGVLIQTFGMGAPSYPLLAYAQGGVIVQ